MYRVSELFRAMFTVSPGLFDLVDGAERLARALAVFEASGNTPDALVFTGDLADVRPVDRVDEPS